jgi:hypothetical protein
MVWLPTDGKHLNQANFLGMGEALVNAPELAEMGPEMKRILGPDFFASGRCNGATFDHFSP